MLDADACHHSAAKNCVELHNTMEVFTSKAQLGSKDDCVSWHKRFAPGSAGLWLEVKIQKSQGFLQSL